jgi:hypothetical protein
MLFLSFSLLPILLVFFSFPLRFTKSCCLLDVGFTPHSRQQKNSWQKESIRVIEVPFKQALLCLEHQERKIMTDKNKRSTGEWTQHHKNSRH